MTMTTPLLRINSDFTRRLAVDMPLRMSMRSTKSPKATAPPLSRDSAIATSLTPERRGHPSPETVTSSAFQCSTQTTRSRYRPRLRLERRRQGPIRHIPRRPFQRTEDRLDRAIKAPCNLLHSQGALTRFSNTRSILVVGHREIFDINVPHTQRQTYRQTDVLHVPEF